MTNRQKSQMTGNVNIFMNGAIPSYSTRPTSPKFISGPQPVFDDKFSSDPSVGGTEEDIQENMDDFQAEVEIKFNYNRSRTDLQQFSLENSCLPPHSESDANIPSIRLLEELGFTITKRVEVFREVEMSILILGCLVKIVG